MNINMSVFNLTTVQTQSRTYCITVKKSKPIQGHNNTFYEKLIYLMNVFSFAEHYFRAFC